ncbi:MAG: protein adenylyltransferase SelO [Tissierella sp.]|uniref:protein adenylyltransferase SelO n=1 Tax=Tissierella sp. TaxID=41274 RepID=UPI003F96AB25
MHKNNLGWKIENSYSKLPEFFYSKVKPNLASSPKLVTINEPLVKSLGLNIEGLKSEEGISILAGNKPLKGDTFLAMAYAGHQFGHFTMLGDGRATLSSMLREYIISEGMYGLNIPTSRSLSVVTTGDKIVRENREKGAILTRVAKSHIRVGTFEYAANFGTETDIKTLADYSIDRHFPYIKTNENPYLSLLKEVIKVQAGLISKWQLVGFIHGVMNTDNMAISGETIDYGPCAFMDTYDSQTVFSSIDRFGRYSYKNQPSIGKWNLTRFAETLLSLIDSDMDKSVKLAKETINEFDDLYYKNYIKGMRNKLGIFNEEVEDKKLIEELFHVMERHNADYTNTFIDLTFDRFEENDMFKSKEFKSWKDKWDDRLNRQEEGKDVSRELMKKSNPSLIPRNYLVEEALDAADKGDLTHFNNLLDALSDPYDHLNIDDKYTKTPKPSSIPYVTYCGT